MPPPPAQIGLTNFLLIVNVTLYLSCLQTYIVNCIHLHIPIELIIQRCPFRHSVSSEVGTNVKSQT